jgi:hypothetical protein
VRAIAPKEHPQYSLPDSRCAALRILSLARSRETPIDARTRPLAGDRDTEVNREDSVVSSAGLGCISCASTSELVTRCGVPELPDVSGLMEWLGIASKEVMKRCATVDFGDELRASEMNSAPRR